MNGWVWIGGYEWMDLHSSKGNNLYLATMSLLACARIFKGLRAIYMHGMHGWMDGRTDGRRLTRVKDLLLFATRYALFTTTSLLLVKEDTGRSV